VRVTLALNVPRVSNNELQYRTFVNAWQASMRIHEVIAENRSRFAQRLSDISEELNSLAKHVDKGRKEVYVWCTRSLKIFLTGTLLLIRQKSWPDVMSVFSLTLR
jgi:hypothetical protein